MPNNHKKYHWKLHCGTRPTKLLARTGNASMSAQSKVKMRCDERKTKSFLHISNQACLGVPIAMTGNVGVPWVSGGYSTVDVFRRSD